LLLKLMMGVGKRPKPTWIIPLIIALAITLAIVSVLLLTHAVNKPGTPAPIGSSISIYLGPTIYVVGSQSLIQELINASIPQSAIRPANVPNLSLIPPGSVVVIDWNYLLNYFSNNASLIIDSLESLFRGEDLIVIAVSNPNESLAASSALAIAWARAYGSKFTMYPASLVDYTWQPLGTGTT